MSLSLLLTNVSSVYDTVFYLSYTTAIFQWRSWATSQTPTGIGVESAVFGYSSSKSSFSTDTDEDCFPRLFEKIKVVYVLCVSPACEQNLIVNFSHSPCHLKGPLANSPKYYIVTQSVLNFIFTGRWTVLLVFLYHVQNTAGLPPV